jgi:3-methyladenine DNA glycosylase AlkC
LMEDKDEDVKQAAANSLRKRKKTASPEEREIIDAWLTLMEIGII